MNPVLDIHAAVDSADCSWPGCDREAEREGRCRFHVGRQPIREGGVEPMRCRVEGCGEISKAQKGPWRGWCARHQVEEVKRRSAKRRDRQSQPAAPSPNLPVVVAPSAIAPAKLGVMEPSRQPGRLTLLAQEADAAQHDLDAALARREHALEALRTALNQEDAA